VRYLIEYNREEGRVVTFKTFSDAQKLAADRERLELELRRLADGISNEIVILDASSEDALRLTHARYFEDFFASTGKPMRVAEPAPGRPTDQ
jgi:hypothetical protein